LIKAPNETYTIDFVLNKDFSVASFVEINDPPPTAGTSLFLLENSDDRKLLMEGPFTFRVLPTPVAWSSADLHAPLMEFIDTLRKRKEIPSTQPTITIIDKFKLLFS